MSYVKNKKGDDKLQVKTEMIIIINQTVCGLLLFA